MLTTETFLRTCLKNPRTLFCMMTSPAQVEDSLLLSVGSLARQPLNMAEPKKDLLKKLQQQADHSKAEALQDELQAEKIRCRHLSVKLLGQETLATLKFAGKTVREAHQEIQHVIWIVGHQSENPKFVKLVEYASRTGYRNKEEEPTASNSGDEPTRSDNQAEWQEVEDPGNPNAMSDKGVMVTIGAIYETMDYFKNQIEQLEQSHQQHQVALYQAMSVNAELREKVENLNARLTEIEAVRAPQRP